MSSRLCRWPSMRCVFLQSQMSAVEMVIANVLRQQTLQVTLVERNDVIQKISPTTSNPAFSHSILPRASERSSDRSQPNGFHGFADHFSELGIAIHDYVFVGR